MNMPPPPTAADRERALAKYQQMLAEQSATHANTQSPSFLAKAVNFASAAVKHVAAGAPMASDEEIARRHDICVACEFYDGKACKKCGCPVAREKQYLSKISWADTSCPVGKWGPALKG